MSKDILQLKHNILFIINGISIKTDYLISKFINKK